MSIAGIVDQRDRRVDHLAEIVRRDVGRHADGDAAGAVDQQVREARRQDHRLLLGAVVVRRWKSTVSLSMSSSSECATLARRTSV